MNHSHFDERLNQLKQDDHQQKMADEITTTLFKSEQEAKNTAQMINFFIDDYLEHRHSQPIDVWLLERFNDFPEIWETEQEKIDTVTLIISTIDSLTTHQAEIDQQLGKGKTLTQVFNQKVRTFSDQYNLDALELQHQINSGLKSANESYSEWVMGEAVELNPSDSTAEPTIIEMSRQNQDRMMTNASLNLAIYATKRAGQRLWNSLQGKENPKRSEELLHILRTAVDSVENRGVQVALSGGVIVSAKKGWINGMFNSLEKIENAVERSRAFFEQVPVVVSNVAEGWNDLRILDKVERGVIQTIDAVKEKAKFAVAKTITVLEKKAEVVLKQGGKTVGMALGTSIGSLFSPAGAVLGGQIGGFVGEKIGSFVSDKIVKPVAEVARKVATKAVDIVANSAKSLVSKGKSVVSKVGRKIKSFFSFW